MKRDTVVKKANVLIALLLLMHVCYTSIMRAVCKPCVYGKTATLCVPCPRSDGSLDITFGNHGLVTTNIEGGDAFARAVVTLPCGTVIAVGFSNASTLGNYDFALAAYTSYGVLDKDFGNNGIVLTDIGRVLSDERQQDIFAPSTDKAMAVALQNPCNECILSCNDACIHRRSDKIKIVVVGSSTATETGHTSFAIARYNRDGSLDSSFGTGGVVITPIGTIYAAATSVAIQRDNKIVVAGFTITVDGINFAVARYNCDGSLDRTFGCHRTGIVTINFGGNDFAQAVKVQRNGKIVVAGSSDARGFDNDFALVRLTSSGRLDKTFGPEHTGKVLTDFSCNGTSCDSANALVLIEDCFSCCNGNGVLKIIAAGSSSNHADSNSDFALAAYNDNGSPDKEFGQNRNGLVTTNFSDDSSSDDKAFAVVLEPSKCNRKCKIIVAGSSTSDNYAELNVSNVAVARYTLRGLLDSNFGNHGKVVTSFDHNSSAATAVTIAHDGDIIVAGRSLVGYASDFALARYAVCVPCC